MVLGKVMLMPEKNPATDIIMIATGTGIAPYRYIMMMMFTWNSYIVENGFI
jgi:ferredoxin--NADP+ reductase